jgi:hypothetical protein
MALAGPGYVTSVNFNSAAPTVTAPYVEGFSQEPTPDTYESAEGTTVERGSIRKVIRGRIWDYSAGADLLTLQTNRTAHDLVVTYIDGGTATYQDGIVTLTPITNVVTDVVKVLFDDAATGTLTNLDAGTGWTDAGVTLDVPQPEYTVIAGSNGTGLPYFSACRMTCEFMLPLATYANYDSLIGVETYAALKLPSGNWQVLKGRLYRHYMAEDGTRPRGIRLRLDGVASAFSTLVQFHDGSAGAYTPPDYLAGWDVTYTCFHTAESSLVAYG